MKIDKFIAVAQVMLAFVLWSTLGVFFNWVKLPVSVSVVYGSTVGLLALYAYFYWRRRRIPRFQFSWPLLVLFLVAAVKGVIWFNALSRYPIVNAMLIHNLAPVIATLLSPIFLKEKPRFHHIIAIVTGFVGLILLLQVKSVAPLVGLGAILSLGTAIASGVQDVTQRKLSNTLSGLEQAFIFILGQALGSVVFLLPVIAQPIGWNDIITITYFGIVGTAVPIILLSSAFRRLRAFEVATLGYAEPALGGLWGAIFLKQPIAPATLLGGLLIFVSGLTAIREEK